MILLDKTDYNHVIDALNYLPFNTLFAKSVLKFHAPGLVYVNNIKDPQTFYIAHKYGMSLLFGDTKNEEFNACLYDYMINKNKSRTKNEWLQVSPKKTWRSKLKILLGTKLAIEKIEKEPKHLPENKIAEYTRVNFAFNKEKYLKLKQQLNTVDEFKIIKTGRYIFENMPGTVIVKYFWNDINQFLNQGTGFSLIYNGETASTAFAAYVHEDQYELGIETIEKYRGKGFALHVCSAFIDYCLEKGYTPVWSCRYDNTGSYKLAQKSGFEPTFFLPYYKLIL